MLATGFLDESASPEGALDIFEQLSVQLLPA
jgi:hypothetical protein